MKIFAVLFLFTCGSWAQTFGVYSREQSGSLPQGRMMISDLAFQSQIDSMYDYSSNKKSLSSNLNRQVTYGDIAKDDKQRQAQLQGLFAANDVGLETTAGAVTGSIKTLVDGHVPVLGYGVTDDISVVITVPMIHFIMSSNYQFNNSSTTNDFIQRLQQQDQTSVAKDFKKAFQYSLETKLNKLGYKWNGYVDRKVVGDTQIYILKKINEDEMLSGIIILPTADAAKTDDIFEIKGGDKKIGFGVKYGLQNKFDNGYSVSNSISNTLLLPTIQSRRLYLTEDNELKEGLDENTQLGLVDRFSYQLQGRYEFPNWLGLSAGFVWQYKTAEHYTGDKYDAAVYNLNSSRTAEDLKSYFVSVDLNSIKSFLAGHFIIPMAIEVGMSVPLAGQNAAAESVYQFQGSLFF